MATLVGVLLEAGQPMFLAWGPERTLIYNDAYVPLLGGKHPVSLGRPFLDVWSEAAPDLINVRAKADENVASAWKNSIDDARDARKDAQERIGRVNDWLKSLQDTTAQTTMSAIKA